MLIEPWITHWALALVKGIREPHEVKKKSFDLGGNRTQHLWIRSTVTLPTELRGRTEKVGDDLGGEPRRSETNMASFAWALPSWISNSTPDWPKFQGALLDLESNRIYCSLTNSILSSLAPDWLQPLLTSFIIHQTHYEKSDWSRAFNQFTIACELGMIIAISAADIAFIMSSSTSAWLLSPLECSPQKQNGWTLCFCFWGWIMWKMYNKTIIEFGFRMISWIIKTPYLCYLPADNTDLGFDNSWNHAQPHPIIVY